jgi:hypothetical protein
MMESEGGFRPSLFETKETYSMNKKLMSIMLGLSLAVGVTSLAFAQDKDDKKTDEGKKKGKKKKTERVAVTPVTVR